MNSKIKLAIKLVAFLSLLLCVSFNCQLNETKTNNDKVKVSEIFDLMNDTLEVSETIIKWRINKKNKRRNKYKISCGASLTTPGGVVAAPLVGEVLGEVLPYLGIQKDLENQIEKEYKYYSDTITYEVDNYIGMKKEDIVTSSNYNIIYYGSGDTVIDQTPSAGEKIEEGGTILLYLD